MSHENINKLIKDHSIEFVDLRFADMRGVQHHVTFPKSIVEPALFEDGKMFDGSSIAGWKAINESDMLLKPDLKTAYIDPFYQQTTMFLFCDVLNPDTNTPYNRDPRSIAKAALARMEVKLVLQELLTRLPDIRIDDNAIDVAEQNLARQSTLALLFHSAENAREVVASTLAFRPSSTARPRARASSACCPLR